MSDSAENSTKTYQELVHACDNFPHPQSEEYMAFTATLWKFTDPTTTPPTLLGFISPPVASALATLPPHLRSHLLITPTLQTISLTPAFSTPTLRTAALSSIFLHLRTLHLFSLSSFWRDESLAIYGPDGTLYAEVERAAQPLLGVVSYYVFLIAYMYSNPSKEMMRLWIQKRAAHTACPGSLDVTAAGAIASQETPSQAIIREAGEEAGFTPKILSHAVPISSGDRILGMRYSTDQTTVRTDCGWGFELCLDSVEGEEPRIVDGEVEEFYELRVEDVKERLKAGQFMPNAAKVLVEWLVSKGEIAEDEVGGRVKRVVPFPLGQA